MTSEFAAPAFGIKAKHNVPMQFSVAKFAAPAFGIKAKLTWAMPTRAR